MKITPDRLRALVSYDPSSGVFRWRWRPVYEFAAHYQAPDWNAKYAGQIAGTHRSDGYRYLKIDGSTIGEHRAAWLYCFGHLPDQTDHINGITHDNRLENLRSTTVMGNARNQKRRSNNRSGVTGVCWDEKSSRWIAYIYVERKMIRLGRFDVLADAAKARKAAERKYAFHPNHGRAA